jgi:hypothetical protein
MPWITSSPFGCAMMCCSIALNASIHRTVSDRAMLVSPLAAMMPNMVPDRFIMRWGSPLSRSISPVSRHQPCTI